jgi:hypothetical protein
MRAIAHVPYADGRMPREGATIAIRDPSVGLHAEGPVPDKAEHGGVLFWCRIGEALAALGWQVEQPATVYDMEDGTAQIDVEKI